MEGVKYSKKYLLEVRDLAKKYPCYEGHLRVINRVIHDINADIPESVEEVTITDYEETVFKSVQAPNEIVKDLCESFGIDVIKNIVNQLD